MDNEICTIGYEGVTLGMFVECLRSASVEVLIDCRIRAQSRKKGFSKTALSEALAQQGIGYVHDRDLGTPKEIMKVFRETKFYDWDAYNAFLSTKKANVVAAARIASEQKICCMCYEADAETCHRRFVAAAIAKITGTGIDHLQPAETET
ncbi:MAG: DUF488 domain-containing protein [Chloroflexi bacterium]|nr:DUF488 domain-containing protein [Chloroflexota bacterium]